jgi:hypothetical protein
MRNKKPGRRASGASRAKPSAGRKDNKGHALVNGFGVLRTILESASANIGSSLSDLTVLSSAVDPYRLDTPAGHRDGQWVAKQLDRAIGKKRQMARFALRVGVDHEAECLR